MHILLKALQSWQVCTTTTASFRYLDYPADQRYGLPTSNLINHQLPTYLGLYLYLTYL